MPRTYYSHTTASKIRACIEANPGWRAKNIAKLIGLRRETVNSYLHSKQSGALGHEVTQDDNYGWHLKKTFNKVQTAKKSPFSSDTRQSNQNMCHLLNREITLPLNLEEAFHGGEKRFQCNDEWLTINLPAGIRQGHKLQVAGKGQYDSRTDQRGDLYFKVKILPHEWFELDGDRVLYRAAIDAEVANYGGEIEVPTLDGPVTVRIPAGIHSGQSLCLRGKGWLTSGDNRGNQLIEILVEPSQENKHSVKEIETIFHRDDYNTLSDNEQEKLAQMLEEAQREQSKQKLTEVQGHSFIILRSGWFWFALLLGGILSLGTVSLIHGLRSPSVPPVEKNLR